MTNTIPTVVILGGTSAVALAYARNSAKDGETVILVGRNKAKLDANVADLTARGANASAIVSDLGDPKTVEKTWGKILKSAVKIDRVLLAYGVLGDQTESQEDLSKLQTELNTNFVSAALWCEAAFTYFRQVGKGQLSVIGSVAGDRGRQSNYHYGAAKGGLGLLMQGMAHRAAQLKEAKVGVLLIKPGFIDTPMTDHIEKGGPLWATPEKIAKIIRRSEKKGKHLIYAPWFWRFILLIIRTVPFFVFKRTGL
ncbi:MAG: SDR family NAD(P)-dependent oxidoreductase [Litorimonas sp.]